MKTRAAVRRIAVLAFAAALHSLGAQQEIPLEKQPVAAAVRADLTKLTDLERMWFAAHKRFTDDLKALNFTPKSGAQIAVSYASARTFSASASHVRLAPLICFSIVSTPGADSPADKPFCTDARYGTAATALARSGPQTQAAPPVAEKIETKKLIASAAPTIVTPVTPPNVPRSASETNILSPLQFADQLLRSAHTPNDSILVVVQFAVKDARYDPFRGVLEIAVESVPLPLERPAQPDTGALRLTFACRTRPAFVCGEGGLTYIARDLWRLPPSRAPSADVLRSGLTMQAQFQLGRRDDTRGPSMTLVALLLQANGVNVSRWEPAPGH